MARWIKADGTEERVYAKKQKWTLEELREKVGGYIELMPGLKTLRVIMNEEGRLRNLPVNERASQIIFNDLRPGRLRYIPVILGDVLILDKTEKM